MKAEGRRQKAEGRRATAVVRQRAEQGVPSPNPHSLSVVGAPSPPMSDCCRRASGFCKVRVSRHKARGVA